jgi:endonuclease/exonuclease/phosphatase (EEP) superfamily protein YafD
MWVLVSTTAMAVTAIAVPRVGFMPMAEAELTVVAANLTGNNPDAGVAVLSLLGQHPDELVLEEVNVHAKRQFPTIETELPYSVVELVIGESQVAVFSRYPVTRVGLPSTLDTGRIIAVEVDGPEPITLIGAHLPRPWWRGQRTQMLPPARQALLTELATWIRSVDGPVVLTGDLNSTDRGFGYRTLTGEAGLEDVMAGGWARSTSTKWWPLMLRIDHVLARGLCGAETGTLRLAGSDHRAVVADLGAC